MFYKCEDREKKFKNEKLFIFIWTKYEKIIMVKVEYFCMGQRMM
jgi:hypothetical protein